MIFYLIMAILTAIIIVTLQLAFNKKKQRKEFGGHELVIFPLIGGMGWQLTLTICILFMLYKFFLKDVHEKIITWISERL
jgi:hypothetical protein